MIIVLHSSKTMRESVSSVTDQLKSPEFTVSASELVRSLKQLSVYDIQLMMKISSKKAKEVSQLISKWTTATDSQRPAIDSFLGDIYSGLQVQTWTKADRDYAEKHLRILSGLYGILKPNDGIYPYRLEMGYRIPNQKYKNMYDYWGESIAETILIDETILNLSAVEYSKVLTKYINKSRFITPKFLTINPKTNQPKFVAVHSKIVRGAFARWVIINRIDCVEKLNDFNELGYEFDAVSSTKNQPVFVCKKFLGLGLSVRLS